MRTRGYLTVNAAADMAGRVRRVFRDELRALHEQHGNILVVFAKNPNAPNAKLWTTIEALKRYLPEAFGDVTQLDIIELREMIVDQGKRLTRVEKKVNIK